MSSNIGEEHERMARAVPHTATDLTALARRARAAERRYARTGSPQALDDAVETWNRILADPGFSAKQPRVRLRALNDAGGAFRRRYLLRGVHADLDRAIDCLERAASEATIGSRERMVASSNYAAALNDRSRVTGHAGDADRALELMEDCLRQTPPGARGRPARLHGVALGLSERYDRTGNRADLDRAATLLEEAMADLGRADTPDYLSLLGGVLFRRFGHTGNPADMTGSLAAWEAAAERTNDGDPRLPAILCNLAIGYAQRAAVAGDPGDLSRSIDGFDQALAMLPEGNPTRPAMLGNLCHALLQRHLIAGAPADLERALGAAEAAVAGTPPGSSGRASALFNLARAHRRRFEGTGDAANLDRAIEVFGEIASTSISPHPAHAAAQMQLGLALSERYQRDGRADDGDGAIKAFERVVACAPGDARERPQGLNNLALVLRRRYERLLRVADLERAITLLQEAVRCAPAGSIERAAALSNLGGTLHSRYLRSGDAGDLDRGIRLMEEAIASAPEGARESATFRSHLGTALRDRYLRTGHLADLERGIGTIEEGIAGTQSWSPDLPVMLGHLGLALTFAYEHTHDRSILARSVEALQHGVARTNLPTERAFLLGSLGCALSHVAQISGSRDDLDRAILAFQSAVDSDPSSHNLPTYLGNLARGLHERYRRTGDPADLSSAIRSIEAALQLASASPILPWFQLTLADLLHERFRRSHDEADLNAAVQTYARAAQGSPGSVSTLALRAARSWGDWASERESWREAAHAYGAGLDVLVLLFRTQWSVDAKRAWLRAAEGLATEAAFALAKDDRDLEAAIALERGRALFLAEALDVYGADLERLREAGHGDLVDRYLTAEASWREAARTASALLEGVGAADPFARVLAERWGGLPPGGAGVALTSAGTMEALRAEFVSAVEAIQAVAGFENFHAQPGISDLQAAARTAPLVFLSSKEEGGFAIIVRGDPVTATTVWLPDASSGRLKIVAVGYLGACARWRTAPGDRAAFRDWMAALNNVTMWLSSIMGPVLAALGEAERASLIPGGWFALLPLHAAWTDDASTPDGGPRASDRIALSYAPSARALAIAASTASTIAPNTLLAVEEPRPVRGSELPNAAREVHEAARWFNGCLVLRHREATRKAIIDALPGYAVVHFACHATASLGNPLDSALAMANEEALTVRDLIELRIRGARLAVLSACETALPGIELLDEQLGLPTCLMQAGFSGVVATQWPVHDLAAMLLIRRFYEGWRGEGLEPSVALHRAQQWVRDTTNAEKLAVLVPAQRSASDTGAGEGELAELLGRLKPDGRDFAHPNYWAAFIHVGA